MVPTVVLLLSLLTVRGSADCEDLKRATVSNLQYSIKHERQDGFPEVFPKNYYVQHRFNGSTECEEPCCVFRAVMLLSNSWQKLLLDLETSHLKRSFIAELIFTLDNIGEEGFRETPDPSSFPTVHSSPGVLLDFTRDIFSKWLDLRCPVGNKTCIFPTPAPLSAQTVVEREEGIAGLIEELHCGKNRDRAKRCVTDFPTNGDVGQSASPGLFLCATFSLWMLLDVELGELG